MEYAVQDIKVSEYGTGRGKLESFKNWILRCFSERNTISLRD